MATRQSSEKLDSRILPAWFIERMTGDVWSFGLQTTDGTVICISRIWDVHKASDGSIWLDVELLAEDDMWAAAFPKRLTAPTDRAMASVNASHVVAAFEIANT